MKALFISFLLILGPFFAHSQNQISLELNHTFNDQPLAYGQNYSDQNGKTIQFQRVRYYLSSLQIVHDGGQITTLDDLYLLVSANVSDYDLGSYPIQNIEKLRFDVGVDYDANHGNSNNYDSFHPLGPQAPLMDWGWPAGYFFFDINGMIDGSDDGDPIPNDAFEFRGFGDNLLRNVELNYDASANNGNIVLSTQVILDRWVGTLDLYQIGINHGNTPSHSAYMNNLSSNNVFVTGQLASVRPEQKNTYIHIDYSMAYAPVFSYSLADKQKYSLQVYDLSGRLVYQDDNLNYQGNYFIVTELNSGTYIAKFTGDNHYQSKRFIVRK